VCPSPLAEPAERISRNGLPRLHSLDGSLHDLVQLCGHSSPTSERAGNVSPDQQLNLPRCFPMCTAFPRSEYYQRVRLPPSLLSPSGWSIRLTYSACFLGRDGSGSPRCHDASISVHAVLLDPAGVSSDLRLCGRLLLPSRFSTLSASGYVTRLNRFTCVTAWTSLCLRLTHVVTFMSPRLDSRWVGSSLSGVGVSPAESAGLNLAHRRTSLTLA
jgi:hypothetical protein